MSGLPINAGVNFQAEDNVCAFTKVQFALNDSAGGQYTVYPVTRLEILLRLDAIPAVRISLGPKSYKLGSLGDEGAAEAFFAEPINPTLADYLEIAANLQEKVQNSEITAQLLVEVEQKGVKTSIIDLTGWALVAASSGETAAGAIELTVLIQHPAAHSDDGVGVIPNPPTVPRPPTFVGANLVDLFVEAQEAYLKEAGVPTSDDALGIARLTGSAGTTSIDCTESLSDVAKTIRERLKDAIAQFKKNFAWANLGGGDLPFSKATSLPPNANYFGKMLWPSVGQPGSIYATFKRYSPGFELVISGVPTNDPLLVYPFVPWGKASLTLFDGEIGSIALPTLGVEDIGGVLTRWLHGQTAEGFGVFKPIEANNQVTNPMELTSLGGYLCPLMEPPRLLAPIQETSLPPWLANYVFYLAVGFVDDANAVSRNNINLGIKNIYTTGLATKPAKPEEGFDISELVKIWAKHYFFCRFHQGNQVEINTRLLITSPSATTPGGYVRPGMVVKVSSVSGQDAEKPILYFYLHGVTHIIDPGTQAAYTRLSGAYARFAKAIPAAVITEELIAEGIPNSLYETVGQFTRERA